MPILLSFALPNAWRRVVMEFRSQTSGEGSLADLRCFRPTKDWLTHGIIIVWIKEVRSVSVKKTHKPKAAESAHAKRADEAMRRAAEEATRGPREARAGRFSWKPAS